MEAGGSAPRWTEKKRGGIAGSGVRSSRERTEARRCRMHLNNCFSFSYLTLRAPCRGGSDRNARPRVYTRHRKHDGVHDRANKPGRGKIRYRKSEAVCRREIRRKMICDIIRAALRVRARTSRVRTRSVSQNARAFCPCDNDGFIFPRA